MTGWQIVMAIGIVTFATGMTICSVFEIVYNFKNKVIERDWKK